MYTIAIDPGNIESAYVIWDGKTLTQKGKVQNQVLLDLIEKINAERLEMSLIEMVQSYGKSVGKDIFDTVRWIGRFEQELQKRSEVRLVYRTVIKGHHVRSASGTDSEIRCALIEKYGETGTKKEPNPVYNDSEVKMKADIWSAFAVLTHYLETEKINEVSKLMVY